MAFEFLEMQKWGKSVGRDGMSEAVIKAVGEFDGSYKDAMILAGRLKAIAQAASFDDYWSEKVLLGYQRQFGAAEMHNRRKS